MEKAKAVKYAKIAVGAVIALVFIIVVAKNFEFIEADLLIVRINMPLALLVLITFLLGAGFGFLGGGLYVRHKLAKDKRTEKKEAL